MKKVWNNIMNFLSEHSGFMMVVGLVIVIGSTTAFGAIISNVIDNHFYKETTQMIIEVENKTVKTNYIYAGKVLVPNHRYYIEFDKNKIEVSNTLYNQLSVGDKLIINVTTTYRREDNSPTGYRYWIDN